MAMSLFPSEPSFNPYDLATALLKDWNPLREYFPSGLLAITVGHEDKPWRLTGVEQSFIVEPQELGLIVITVPFVSVSADELQACIEQGLVSEIQKVYPGKLLIEQENANSFLMTYVVTACESNLLENLTPICLQIRNELETFLAHLDAALEILLIDEDETLTSFNVDDLNLEGL